MFHSSSMVPILWDAANFHGGKLPYNWLFADGHVDNFLSDAQAP
jgi:prepilin-type processing-associated H-X9-DG protein